MASLFSFSKPALDKVLSHILLVNEDDTVNQEIADLIVKNNIAKEVIIKTEIFDTIEFLKKAHSRRTVRPEYPLPQLILLGYFNNRTLKLDFLLDYNYFFSESSRSPDILQLTHAVNKEVLNLTFSNKKIKGHLLLPLKVDELQAAINQMKF